MQKVGQVIVSLLVAGIVIGFVSGHAYIGAPCGGALFYTLLKWPKIVGRFRDEDRCQGCRKRLKYARGSYATVCPHCQTVQQRVSA